MTLIAIMLLAYLFVAPDKGTLSLTRGATGAARAVLGMPPRGARTSAGGRSALARSSKSDGSPKGGNSSRRPLLAGWREGVASARVAREEGRDAWSRTSRGAGRAVGGSRNIAAGIRTTVGNRRGRRTAGIAIAPDEQTTIVTDPTAEPASGQAVGNGDQAAAGDVGQRPVDAVNETADDAPEDGRLLFSSKTDDLGAAIGEPAQETGELNEVAEEPPADSRYYVWESPDSGQYFVFDRMNLDEPMPCLNERDADLLTGFYNDRHGLATQNGEEPAALAGLPSTATTSDDVPDGDLPDAADSYSGGAFDRNGVPWPIVITGPDTMPCPKCGEQTVRVDDSFDADEASSTWSNAYRCTHCSAEGRFKADLSPSEHKELFPRFSPEREAELSELAERLAADIHPIPQTPTTVPVMGDTTSSTTTISEGTTPMSIAGTELANLDEVAGEASAALNAIEALTEALSEIKGWAGNLPDRWSGTTWSTDRLDSAITGTAEAAQELKVPEALMEQLASIATAVKEARSVGEVAAETGAKGDLSGFRGN